MKKIARRELIKRTGVAGITCFGATGMASGDTKQESLSGLEGLEESSLSVAETRKLLGKAQGSAELSNLKSFLQNQGYKIDFSTVEGSQIEFTSGELLFKQVKASFETPSTKNGVLIVRFADSQISVQALVFSETKQSQELSETYYCNPVTIASDVGPIVNFQQWSTLTRKISPETTAGPSTSAITIDPCATVDGADLCAAIGLLGAAAGTIVAAAEPTPFGDLAVVGKIGTVGAFAGGASTACDAAELVDSYFDCDADSYQICFKGVFVPKVKITPTCML